MMMDCRWTGTLTPRALLDRHEDDCADTEWCRGCLPCPKHHCVICGIEHVTEQTCPECIATVRNDLAQIVVLYATLFDHAVNGANHDLNINGRLEAARGTPGGESLVMLAPGAKRGDIGINEHWPTEMVLVGWEDDWRAMKHHHTDATATLAAAARYLNEHLSWAAQNHYGFDSFAEEIRTHRAHLEDVLHTGDRPDLGAPCPTCKKPLERIWSEKANNDRWWCERCKVTLRPDEYKTAVARDGRKFATWLSAQDMAEEYEINRGTLQGWAGKKDDHDRPLVRKRRDWNTGRMVYNVADARDRQARMQAEDERDTA